MFCDENVTSHVFVTVPHSNPGPSSEKISARKDTQACRGCLVMPRGTRSGSRNPWSRHPRNGWACKHKPKTFGCAAWCSQWHFPRGLALCDRTTNWSTTSFSAQFSSIFPDWYSLAPLIRKWRIFCHWRWRINCFRSARGDARLLVGKDTKYSVP